jgi:DNA ligase (NAD+)
MDPIKVIKKLRKADEAYYLTDQTKMSDEDYDTLKKWLQDEHADNPEVKAYLSQVGAPLAAHLDKVKHKIPMGSLSNSMDEAEYRKWHGKHGQPIVMTPKMDGSSIEIIYENGKLVQAITRGDGIEGEDVTRNVRKFKNVPTELEDTMNGSVRGEAMLLIADFAEFFDSANPRNAANGTVRRSDGSGAEHMVFFAFDVVAKGFNAGDLWKTYEDKLIYLAEIGFETVQMALCESADEAIETHGQWATDRDSLPYEIDGMVARVNDEKVFNDMGVTDNRPKGGTAYKFKAMERTTVLELVVLTVGHTGAIIPTGKLKPVEIGGVTVSSVLLNNFEEIERLGVALKDEVKVIRAGDVIPKVIGVAQPGKDRVEIEVPTVCPVCESELVKDGAHLFCRNDGCDARVDALVKSWVKKRNILYLGDTLREYLYEQGIVKTAADLYRLDVESLAEMPIGAGKVGRNAERIMAEIEKSKTATLAEFMGSLGIKMLGRREAKHIIDDGVDTLDKWLAMTADDFEKLPRFSTGGSKATAIAEGIDKVRDLIADLLEVGVKIEEPEEEEAEEVAGDGVLAGKSFCFTGAIQREENGKRLTRKDMWALVKANGGVAHEKPVAGTTYLVQADPESQSSKTKKAIKLGVEVLAEAAFFEMIG